MGQSQSSATVATVLNAAVLAYGNPDTPPLGPQWTQISLSQIAEASGDQNLAEDMSRSGYSGLAWVNENTGEVIIASQGMVPSQVGNKGNKGQIPIIQVKSAPPAAHPAPPPAS